MTKQVSEQCISEHADLLSDSCHFLTKQIGNREPCTPLRVFMREKLMNALIMLTFYIHVAVETYLMQKLPLVFIGKFIVRPWLQPPPVKMHIISYKYCDI